MESLINKKFGKLTVIGFFERNNAHKALWSCKCECGKEVQVYKYNLERGNTRSCGCLSRGNSNSLWKGIGELSASKYYEYKKNAKIRNLIFNVSMEELWDLFLKQNRRCALTGEILVFQKTTKDRNSTASLDRIDSSQGYVINNVRWILKDLNYMKLDMSDEYFLDLCCKVSNYRKNKI